MGQNLEISKNEEVILVNRKLIVFWKLYSENCILNIIVICGLHAVFCSFYFLNWSIISSFWLVPLNVMEMVQETMHLEQMGYRILETVRNIAFQRNQYLWNSRKLGAILDFYYASRRNLRPAEASNVIAAFKSICNQFQLCRRCWWRRQLEKWSRILSMDFNASIGLHSGSLNMRQS